MAKRNLWLGMLVMVLAFGMMVVGCMTATPVLYTDNVGKEFITLGEVTLEVKLESKFGTSWMPPHGFNDLLKAAKVKYPECDYVIDIMIDATISSGYYSQRNRSGYIMRGTAIKYTK